MLRPSCGRQALRLCKKQTTCNFNAPSGHRSRCAVQPELMIAELFCVCRVGEGQVQGKSSASKPSVTALCGAGVVVFEMVLEAAQFTAARLRSAAFRGPRRARRLARELAFGDLVKRGIRAQRARALRACERRFSTLNRGPCGCLCFRPVCLLQSLQQRHVLLFGN